jgi:PAS domain S-box-containing protein
MTSRLLLVDDEAGIRKVLGLSLRDAGYVVLTAADGREGLALFERERPPIVLTDIKMPGLDGIQLLQRIKAIDPETEVIMITGHGDMDLAIQSLQFDAADFVNKPINPELLDLALKRAEERGRMRRELREYTLRLEDMVREKSEKLIRAERLAAVGQVVESLSASFRGMVDDIEGDVTLFNDLPCFVAIHNRDLRVLSANQLFVDRFGDRVGSGSWEIYSGPAQNPNLCPVAKTLEADRGLRLKEQVRSGDGSSFPVIVHTTPIRSENGDVDLVMEISADITEVRKLQEDLWDAQTKYHQLFENAPCYITLVGPDLRIQAVNKQFERDFGRQVGARCHDVYYRPEKVCPNCPVEATFRDNGSHQTETIVTNRDEEERHLLISTAPIWDEADRVVQVMEMAVDITEIRRLESRLTRLGLLMGSVSHSVKGLLTGLDGGLYLMRSGLAQNKPERIEEGWRSVDGVAGRIRKLVMDILYFSKERDLKWDWTNPLDVARDAAEAVAVKAAAQQVSLIQDFDREVGALQADASALHTALLNILENAVEACAENKTGGPGRVAFRVHGRDERIIFVVEDNGVGMDDETRGRLFELLYSSKGDRGTGFGLYITHNVIRRHGGEIRVDSSPGRGARFEVSLPRTFGPGSNDQGEQV